LSDAPDAAGAAGDAAKPRRLARFYEKSLAWMEHWAKTSYGPWVLFWLAFVESSFFPILPPDVLLLALALAVPKKAFRFAAICSVGSVLGGCFGYLLGMSLSGPVIGLVRACNWQDSFFAAGYCYEVVDFLAVFTAGLTPIPYILFTLAAGIFGINFWAFLLASILSRSMRFFLEGAIAFFVGEQTKRVIGRYFNKVLVLFCVLLVGGFALFSLIGGNPDYERIESMTRQEFLSQGDAVSDDDIATIRVAIVGRRAKSEVVLKDGKDFPGRNRPAYLFVYEDQEWRLDREL